MLSGHENRAELPVTETLNRGEGEAVGPSNRAMEKDEGELIAGFGYAKLIKTLDCKYELRDGSHEDRLAAREWISLFCMRRW